MVTLPPWELWDTTDATYICGSYKRDSSGGSPPGVSVEWKQSQTALPLWLVHYMCTGHSASFGREECLWVVHLACTTVPPKGDGSSLYRVGVLPGVGLPYRLPGGASMPTGDEAFDAPSGGFHVVGSR